MDAIHLDQFPKVSMSEWKAAIELELKGSTWESLVWRPEEGVALEPAYHADSPVTLRRLPNIQQGRWKIGERFVIDHPGNTNASILAALQMGLDAPEIIVTSDLNPSEILTGIVSNYIDTSWNVPSEADVHTFMHALDQCSDGSSPIQGGWIQPCYADVSLGRHLKSLLDTYDPNTYIFRWVTLEQDASETYSKILGRSLSAIHAILTRGREQGCMMQEVLASLAVRVPIRDSLLLSVAAIRAMRLLYLNLTSRYSIRDVKPLFIDAYTNTSSYVEDANYNRIKGALMGWSAVVGGADRITITPGSPHHDSPFERRIARNIHHLLAMESHLDKVADPLSGSYYIEAATTQLAHSAWQHFQEVEASGLFLDGEALIHGK